MDRPLRAVIVDDEALARAELRRMLVNDERVEVFAEAENCLQAEVALAAGRDSGRPVEILFLDMQMPGISALEWLEKQRNPPSAIIVSAHESFALRAIRSAPIDYLLKPVEEENLLKAIDKVWKKQVPSSPYLERLLVREGDHWYWIDFKNVRRLQADGNFTRVMMGERKSLIAHSLSSLEERLSPQDFLRISRSEILNISHVKRFEVGTAGRLIALLANGEEVEVSSRRSTILKKRFAAS